MFEDVIGANSQSMHFVSDAGAERLTVSWVTPNTFAFLGVGPLIGRHFGPADAAPDAPRVAVLNHRTWMTLFGGDPASSAAPSSLNDEPRTIIGVMPPRFEWHVADLWIPGPLDRNDDPRKPAALAGFRRGCVQVSRSSKRRRNSPSSPRGERRFIPRTTRRTRAFR